MIKIRKPLGNRVDSVARSLEILGDKWIFLILREAFFGVKNYDRFQANLGIASNILSRKLKSLIGYGIMEKRQDPADGRKFMYRLTEKGLDLYSVTLAFMQWGDKWLAGEKGPPLALYHKTCGHRLEPVMTCRRCGAVVRAKEVTYKERLRK